MALDIVKLDTGVCIFSDGSIKGLEAVFVASEEKMIVFSFTDPATEAGHKADCTGTIARLHELKTRTEADFAALPGEQRILHLKEAKESGQLEFQFNTGMLPQSGLSEAMQQAVITAMRDMRGPKNSTSPRPL